MVQIENQTKQRQFSNFFQFSNEEVTNFNLCFSLLSLVVFLSLSLLFLFSPVLYLVSLPFILASPLHLEQELATRKCLKIQRTNTHQGTILRTFKVPVLGHHHLGSPTLNCYLKVSALRPFKSQSSSHGPKEATLIQAFVGALICVILGMTCCAHLIRVSHTPRGKLDLAQLECTQHLFSFRVHGTTWNKSGLHKGQNKNVQRCMQQKHFKVIIQTR